MGSNTVFIKANLFEKYPNITKLVIDGNYNPLFTVQFENNIIPPQIKTLNYSNARLDVFLQYQSNSIEDLHLENLYQSDNTSPAPITKTTFTYFKSLKSLTLCHVTINEPDALDDLTELKSLTIGNRDIDIVEGLFNKLKLENLTLNIESSVPEIGEYINSFGFNFDNLKTLRIQSNLDIPFTTPIQGLKQLTTFGFSNNYTLVASSESNKRITQSEEKAIHLSVLGNSIIENIEIFASTETTCNYNTLSYFPNVKTITLGEGIEQYSDSLLQGLESITLSLPSTMTEVNATALKEIPNIYVIAPPANPNYCFGDGVFYSTGYSTIVEIIPQSEVITIHEGPTTIPDNMFSNNGIVKNISLPSTLNQIESGAFSGCSNLENMRCESTKVDFGENIFDEGKEITVSVPEDYQGDNFGGSNIVKEDNPSGGNEESPDPSKGNDGDPLDGGAIAGIVIAVVVVIAAICIGVFLYLKKKNTSSASSGSSSSSNEAKV